LGLLALAFVVAATLVQGQGQHGCCTPRQWEGDIAGFNKKDRTRFFEFLSYDYLNARFRADVYADVDDRRIRETIIEKWMDGENRRYTVKPDGSCTYKLTERPFREACVPAYNREFSFTLGGTLKSHGYHIEHGNETGIIIAAARDCIPINGVFFERHSREHGPNLDISYWDITVGIRDPLVFVVPDNCKKS
jgi:hypothetical protein